jgi:hypothetical protein
LAREKVVDEGGKQMWNGVEAVEEVRLQLDTGGPLAGTHPLSRACSWERLFISLLEPRRSWVFWEMEGNAIPSN